MRSHHAVSLVRAVDGHGVAMRVVERHAVVGESVHVVVANRSPAFEPHHPISVADHAVLREALHECIEVPPVDRGAVRRHEVHDREAVFEQGKSLFESWFGGHCGLACIVAKYRLYSISSF